MSYSDGKRLQEDPGHVPEIRLLNHRGVVYTLGHQLALGATSVLFTATDDWGNQLAVKRYGADTDPLLWRNEVKNLKILRHPFINFMHDAFEQNGWRYVVLERYGVALRRVKVSDPTKRAQVCRTVARRVLEALHFIHRNGYVHGDVNPGNVLFKVAGTKGEHGIKLCDLALCMPKESRVGRWPIATRILPPEHHDRSAFNATIMPQQDIYQAARLLLTVFTGEHQVFEPSEIVSGRPQQAAMELGTSFGRALARGLDSQPNRRPGAVEFWRMIAAAQD